jgi:fructose-1,6-bisphosphatase/inositol monophosphatase family enzyme
MPDLDLAKAMDVARRAVEAASAASLAHFRRGVHVERKPDRTPVTQADRDSEAAILAVVRDAFPDLAFLGEETGAHAGSAETRWIVDPLDGTKGFTRGGGFWGALAALEHQGRVVAGAMALPALGETYWAARGKGAWLRAGDAPPQPLRVSAISDSPASAPVKGDNTAGAGVTAGVGTGVGVGVGTGVGVGETGANTPGPPPGSEHPETAIASISTAKNSILM